MRIGNDLGKLMILDKGLTIEGWDPILRVRVEVDVNKLFRRFVKLAGKLGAKETRERITFERLPIFCNRCGRLGRSEAECEE